MFQWFSVRFGGQRLTSLQSNKEGAIRYVRRAVVALLISCSALYAGGVGFLWANETRIVFRNYVSRAAARAGTPVAIATRDGGWADAVRVELTTADGLRLEAVRLDAADAAAPWVVFFHGSGHSIHNPRVQVQLAQLHALGYTVLAPEYRGFGRNEGRPSEAGLYEDASAAYRYVTGEMRVAPSRVVLAGRSLGSAVAVEMASRFPSAGVVLFSPIDSIPLMGGRMYPWVPVRFLASNRFDSLSKIGRVRAPVVVVHAVNDRWVPLTAARALFERAVGPKTMLETAGGHNGAGFADVDQLRDALAAFWPVAVASPATH